MYHRQPIPQSPHIEAIVKIKQIINEYTAFVDSSIHTKMLVEFEHIISYNEGDFVYIEGELEMIEFDELV